MTRGIQPSPSVSDPVLCEDLYGNPARVLGRVIAAVSGEPLQSMPVPELARGALYYRELADGRCIALYPLIAGTVRIIVGDAGSITYDDAWCYSTPPAGLLAAAHWDGCGDPPEGWFRHLGTGRRRPEGDAAREYRAR